MFGKKKQGGNKAVPRNLNQLVDKKIKRALQKTMEKKWFTSIATSASVDYSGTIASRSAITQGDADNTRDGDQANLRSFELRYDTLANVLVSILRCVIFQWHPPTSLAAPVIGNILIVNGQAEAVHSPYSVDYAQHFTVLYDKTHYCDTNGTIGQGIAPRVFVTKITSGFKPKMEFIAGASTGSNQIFTLFISDRASTNMPLVRSVTMTRFDDA
jgi:hypothetical protein